MKNTILINLQIEIETTGEQATRDTDARKLPNLSLFIHHCNSLASSLSIDKGNFTESSEDIEGEYPNCIWYGKMTFNIKQHLSFSDATRLLNIIQNFSLYHEYNLVNSTAVIIS